MPGHTWENRGAGCKIKDQDQGDYSIKGQVTKCVKWHWKKEDVLELRAELERYKTSINLMLQSLSSEQFDNVAEIMEKLHHNVLQLQENRKFAKEILEVMKEGHPNFEHPDVNISYNVPVSRRTIRSRAGYQVFRSLLHSIIVPCHS